MAVGSIKVLTMCDIPGDVVSKRMAGSNVRASLFLASDDPRVAACLEKAENGLVHSNRKLRPLPCVPGTNNFLE